MRDEKPLDLSKIINQLKSAMHNCCDECDKKMIAANILWNCQGKTLSDVLNRLNAPKRLPNCQEDSCITCPEFCEGRLAQPCGRPRRAND